MPARYHHHVCSSVPSIPANLFTILGPRVPLSNQIHPIWRRENFLNLDFHANRDYIGLDSAASIFRDPNSILSELTYQRLEPALRLATILLHRARSAMTRILFAPVSSDGTYLTDNYKIALKRNLQYDKALTDISDYTKIFHFNPSHPETNNSIYAFTTSVPPPRYLPNQRCVMAIAYDYIDTIMAASFPGRPASSKCAIYFNLAALLLHELAHALWKHRFYDYIFHYRMASRGLEPMEPSLFVPGPNYTNIRELGEAVETFLFGGRIQLTTHAITGMEKPRPIWTGKSGVCIAVRQSSTSLGVVQMRGLWLTRDGLMNLFDSRFWTTGSTVFGISSTTSWFNQRQGLDLVLSEYPWEDPDTDM